MPGSDGSDDERGSKFSAYADYDSVSRSIAEAVDRANEAYSYVAARKAQGKSVSNDVAVQFRQRMKDVAIRLLPELHANKATNQKLKTILKRWEEDGTAGDVVPEPAEASAIADGGDDLDEDTQELLEARARNNTADWPPYLRGIEDVPLRSNGGLPPWVEQFAKDIRTAAWEIGHLQAGDVEGTGSGDPTEDQANQMFN